MGRLIQAITDHYSQLLIGIIEFCLKHMFQDINDGMKYVVAFAGKGPGIMLPEAFAMIKQLSDNVMLPISCIIISFILSRRRSRHLVVTMDESGEISSTVTKIKHSRGIIVDM